MTVDPPPYPERLLLFGGSGTGKSFAFHSIYRDIVLPNNNHMYVVDTDNASARMFVDDDRSNLHFEEAYNFRTSGVAINKFARKAKRHDWLVIDMVSPVWQWAQDFHLINDLKVKEDELMFWSPPDDKWRHDWTKVNRYYDNFIRVIFRIGCNVIGIATQDSLNTEGSWADEADIRSIFSSVGFKPRGQKQNAHHFHDILYFSSIGGQFMISAPKERKGRQSGWNKHKVTGSTFTQEYLLPAWQGKLSSGNSSKPSLPPAARKKRSAKKRAAKKRAVKKQAAFKRKA